MASGTTSDKNSGAYHTSNAEADEIVPTEVLPHISTGSGADSAGFLEGGGDTSSAADEAARDVGKSMEVGVKARERGTMAVHHLFHTLSVCVIHGEERGFYRDNTTVDCAI